MKDPGKPLLTFGQGSVLALIGALIASIAMVVFHDEHRITSLIGVMIGFGCTIAGISGHLFIKRPTADEIEEARARMKRDGR